MKNLTSLVGKIAVVKGRPNYGPTQYGIVIRASSNGTFGERWFVWYCLQDKHEKIASVGRIRKITDHTVELSRF